MGLGTCWQAILSVVEFLILSFIVIKLMFAVSHILITDPSDMQNSN